MSKASVPKTEFTRIHVACAADGGYGPYAGIALYSVLACNKDATISIHLFSDGIEETDILRIRAVAQKFGAELFVYDMRAKLDASPALQDHAEAHYTRAAYIRLFMPELVPPDVTWMVYMDCDVICARSWREIWERRGEVSVLGAAEDPWINRRFGSQAVVGDSRKPTLLRFGRTAHERR